MSNEIKVYTLRELVPILGVSYRTLLRYVGEGSLPAVMIGGKWKISEENLKAYINGEKRAADTQNA